MDMTRRRHLAMLPALLAVGTFGTSPSQARSADDAARIHRRRTIERRDRDQFMRQQERADRQQSVPVPPPSGSGSQVVPNR